MIVKHHPFTRELVEVRSLRFGSPVTAHRVSTLIISHQEDDVGPFVFCLNGVVSFEESDNHQHDQKGEENRMQFHRATPWLSLNV